MRHGVGVWPTVSAPATSSPPASPFPPNIQKLTAGQPPPLSATHLLVAQVVARPADARRERLEHVAVQRGLRARQPELQDVLRFEGQVALQDRGAGAVDKVLPFFVCVLGFWLGFAFVRLLRLVCWQRCLFVGQSVRGVEHRGGKRTRTRAHNSHATQQQHNAFAHLRQRVQQAELLDHARALAARRVGALAGADRVGKVLLLLLLECVV